MFVLYTRRKQSFAFAALVGQTLELMWCPYVAQCCNAVWAHDPEKS